MITITQYNLHATVGGSTSYYRRLIIDYLNRIFSQYDYINKGRNGRPLLKASFTFFKDNEAYVLREAIPDLLAFFKNTHRLTEAEIHIIREIPDTPVLKLPPLVLNPEFIPYDYQETAYGFINTDRAYNCSLTALATGMGKLEHLSNIVPTPTGPQRWGDLHVGDELIGSDGHPTEITAEYPQPKMMMYKVFFIDGTSTIVGGPHLWKVRLRVYGEPVKILTTDQLREDYILKEIYDKRYDTTRKEYRYSVPRSNGYLGGEDLDLPVHPYLLGVLLGDGSFRSSANKVVNGSSELLESLVPLLPTGTVVGTRTDDVEKKGSCSMSFVHRYGTRTCSTLQDRLVSFGLAGHLSTEKFIPPIYLRASFKQRQAIYQGLIDTDGYVRDDVLKEYSTSAPRLAEDFAYLARSLGMNVSVRSRIPYYTYKGERLKGKKSWRIGECPYGDWKMITGIIPYGKSVGKCVTVAAKDSLYNTTGWNITHNTTAALYACKNTLNPIVVIVKPSLLGVWKKEINFIYPDVPNDEIVVVRGSDAINKLTLLDPEDIPRFILISLASYRTYINKWIRSTHADPFPFETTPVDFFPHLGVRRLIVDEAHRELHAFCMVLLTARVHRLSALSATMLSQDRFIEGIQRTMYPMDQRYDLLLKDSHINYILSEYRVTDIDTLALSPRGRTTYSHNHYEKSILRSRKISMHYMEYITSDLNNGFLNRRRPGDKALILFGTHLMMNAFERYLQEYLAKKYPGVITHIHGAGMEDDLLLDKDVILATNGKLGLGTDIPGVIYLNNTVSISSIDTNIQIMGRLRRPTGKFRRGYRDGTYMDDADRIYVQSHNCSLHFHTRYHENRRYILDKYLKSRRRYLYQYDL